MEGGAEGAEDRSKMSISERLQSLRTRGESSQIGATGEEAEVIEAQRQEVSSSSHHAVPPRSKKVVEKEMIALVKEIMKDAVERPREKYRQLEMAIIAYRDLCLKKKEEDHQSRRQQCSVTDVFCCPHCMLRMADPVTVSTGVTYERQHIEELLHRGNKFCPRTRQQLLHDILTPNHLLRHMIHRWCKDCGYRSPLPFAGPTVQDPLEILDELSSNITQREAAKKLELLSKCSSSYRARLGEIPNFVPNLLAVHFQLEGGDQASLHLLRTGLILSIDDSNKFFSWDPEKPISLVRHALLSKCMETKTLAATALFCLWAVNSNRRKIALSGVMGLLMNLLQQWSSIAKKEAASVIYCFCEDHENRVEMLAAGVVEVLLISIKDESLVAESLAILERLSSDQPAVEEMGRKEAVSIMQDIMEYYPNQLDKEVAARILCTICKDDPRHLKGIREESNFFRISRILQKSFAFCKS